MTFRLQPSHPRCLSGDDTVHYDYQPAVQHLDELLNGFPPHVLTPMWAHMSLRMTDWAIRHFTPSDVNHWLDLAEQRAH